MFVLEIKMADFSLDLRGVACPINFVKTRLFLDKINSGQSLEVWLDDGEPIESVTSSIAAEGHPILSSEQDNSGFHKLCLVKA
jgi:TusA-related sulfurtransferase